MVSFSKLLKTPECQELLYYFIKNNCRPSFYTNDDSNIRQIFRICNENNMCLLGFTFTDEDMYKLRLALDSTDFIKVLDGIVKKNIGYLKKHKTDNEYFIEELSYIPNIFGSQSLTEILKQYFKMFFTMYDVYLEYNKLDITHAMFELAYLGRKLFQLLSLIGQSSIVVGLDNCLVRDVTLPNEKCIHDTLNQLAIIWRMLSNIKKKFSHITRDEWENPEFHTGYRQSIVELKYVIWYLSLQILNYSSLDKLSDIFISKDARNRQRFQELYSDLMFDGRVVPEDLSRVFINETKGSALPKTTTESDDITYLKEQVKRQKNLFELNSTTIPENQELLNYFWEELLALENILEDNTASIVLLYAYNMLYAAYDFYSTSDTNNFNITKEQLMYYLRELFKVVSDCRDVLNEFQNIDLASLQRLDINEMTQEQRCKHDIDNSLAAIIGGLALMKDAYLKLREIPYSEKYKAKLNEYFILLKDAIISLRNKIGPFLPQNINQKRLEFK